MLKAFVKRLFYGLGYSISKRPSNVSSTVERYEVFGNLISCLYTLKANGVDVKYVLDIGGNSAQWSLEAKKVFPGASFYLIEPQKEMIPALDAFCAANTGSKWFLAGAGAEEGELTLTIWDDLQGSSVLVDESNELIHTGKQRKIPIITIDSLLEKGEIHIPQLCKLDIQGFELEALKGATKLFGKTEAFILEVSLFDFNVGTPSFYEIVRFMDDRDYVIYDFPGYAYRPFDSALGQVDMCFVKKNGILRKSHQW